MIAGLFPGDLFPDDVAVVTDTELGMDDAALLACCTRWRSSRSVRRWNGGGSTSPGRGPARVRP